MRDDRVRPHVDEDVGRDEIAAAGPAALGRLDDDGQRRLALALLDVALDLDHRVGADDRADADVGVLGRPDREAAGRLDEPAHEVVVGRLEHDHPRGGRALLPRVVEGRDDDLADGHIEIGVRVDDDRVLAAHLGDDLLDAVGGGVLGRLADDAQPDIHGAGEGDEVHARVTHEEVADLAAGAGEEVDRPRRCAGRLEEARHLRGDHGRGAGRLDDHRVAGDQRRAGHAGEDRERKVPRRDDECDAARLIEVDVVLAGHVAHAPGLAQAQHLAPVVLEEVDRLVDVPVRLAARLAGLERHERGELERLGAHELGRPEQHGRALLGRRVAPRRERRLGSGHGGFGLGTAAVGDRADHLVRGRRVHRRQGLRGLDVAAADAQRVVRAEAAAHRRERRVVSLTVLAAREVGVRLVDERRRIVRVGGGDDRKPGRLGCEVR